MSEPLYSGHNGTKNGHDWGGVLIREGPHDQVEFIGRVGNV